MKNKKIAPTPRTDAAWNSDVDGSELEIVSKQLERELTEKTNEVARLREELQEYKDTQITFTLALLENKDLQIAKLRRRVKDHEKFLRTQRTQSMQSRWSLK